MMQSMTVDMHSAAIFQLTIFFLNSPKVYLFLSYHEGMKRARYNYAGSIEKTAAVFNLNSMKLNKIRTPPIYRIVRNKIMLSNKYEEGEGRKIWRRLGIRILFSKLKIRPIA